MSSSAAAAAALRSIDASPFSSPGCRTDDTTPNGCRRDNGLELLAIPRHGHHHGVLGAAGMPNSRGSPQHDSSDSMRHGSTAGSSSVSRKRKRDGSSTIGGGGQVVAEELLKPSIQVKPRLPNVLVSAPRALEPVMLLPRDRLLLSYLDLSAPTGELPYARSYESHVKILDLEARMGTRPVVLVARSCCSSSEGPSSSAPSYVYVLERQSDGLYSLCRLGSWVDLAALARDATACCWQRIPRAKGDAHEGGGSEASSRPLITPHLHKELKKKRLAIEALQSVVRKPPRSVEPVAATTAMTSQHTMEKTLVSGSREQQSSLDTQQSPMVKRDEIRSKKPQEPRTPANNPTSTEQTQPNTAESIFSNIRSQYIDALYHSMGSLAYFAKGPLSRARAAFHMDCDGNLDMNDLIDFLKSLILTTTLIDKKYRETIPDVLSRLRQAMDSSDDGNAASSKRAKRKPRKMKPGKDGLFPLEEQEIRAWWRARQPPSEDNDHLSLSSPEAKALISGLRTRETQLQMVLMLEILALESLRSPDNDEESQLPGTEATDRGNAAKKKRDKHDLPTLLDVSADRLCIWQSTATEGVDLAESQRKLGLDTQESTAALQDPLRDFCVDIIMPFFAARLPELCDSINRKLGGPLIVSPPKSKPKSKTASVPGGLSQSKTPASTTTTTKPGAAAARRPLPTPAATSSSSSASKPGRTLQRALSNDQQGRRGSMSRGTIANLMRSASTVAIPGLKREDSTEPLPGGGGGGGGTMSSASSRRGSSTGTTLQERSVNVGMLRRSLSATMVAAANAAEEAKARKRALVEAELRDAISALRKPNRELAGKSMAEAAERRALSLSAMRKAKKPVRYGLGQPAVQVKATPANPRFRDALGSQQQQQQQQARANTLGVEPNSVPQSSMMSAVPPSSELRPTHVGSSGGRGGSMGIAVEATPLPASAAAVGSLVMATPCRRGTNSLLLQPPPNGRGQDDDNVVLPSSPLYVRKPAAAADSTSQAAATVDVSDVEASTPVPTSRRQRVSWPPGHLRAKSMGSLPRAAAAVPSSVPRTPLGKDSATASARALSIYQKLGWDDEFDDLA